ncbi:MAG: AraC family transcriptional regulator [Spirochaetia bacterium]|nr:AraC family transcriptional regulator [Spirochaetia bacterium]
MQQKNFFEYLTYSDDDLRWQIVCTDIGATVINPYESYPPQKEKHPRNFKQVCTGRTLKEYQIIYITKGSGTFESEGKRYQVTPGTILFLFPEVRHAYRPDFKTGWTEYWVGCIGKYLDDLTVNGVITPDNPVFHLGLHDTILRTYQDIFERVRFQRPGYQLRLGASIMMLIANIIGYTRQQVQHSHTETYIERAKVLFTENLTGTIEIEEIADDLGISTSHLSNIFKSYTGMTPYQYYLHMKINKAKELLETGELSIKEIAFELSFESQYYFSRLFKKKTGYPPSLWVDFDEEVQ